MRTMASREQMKKKSGVKILPFAQTGEFYFKRALNKLEKNDLPEAIAYYRKALSLEPDNLDIELEMAQTLTEMYRFDESNRILFRLLYESQNSASECYFGMGMNFLGLKEYENARNSFEYYTYAEPEGEYIFEAYDMLDVLDETEEETPEAVEADIQRSKELIEQGEYAEAIGLLLKLMALMPEALHLRNNLALAYYCNYDYANAIHHTNEVLLREPNNTQAHCNMAIFSKGAKDMPSVEEECEYLKNLRSSDPDGLNRAALTLIEMGHIEGAYALQQRLLRLMPYDSGVIHRTALCAYRLNEYRQAAVLYERLIKIDEYDAVARFYHKLCRDSEATGIPYEFALNYQVPVNETIDRIQRINQFISMPESELLVLWKEDKGELEMLIRWGLGLEEHSVKKAMLGLTAGFGDAKAERLIRDFLLSRTQPAELKRDAFGFLKRMGAPEPYIAYIDGELVESKIDMIRLLEGDVPKAYRDVIALCIASMHDERDEDCLLDAAEIWGEYVGRLDGFPRMSAQQKSALAAALEYQACKKGGYEVSKAELCRKYGVTLIRFGHALDKLTFKRKERP